jgi:hypothetical protein
MRRRRNRRAAWWTLVALVFAQLATAAHACPLIERVLNPVAVSAEAEMPCDDMAMPDHRSPSALCAEHCKANDQRVDNPAPIAAVGLPAQHSLTVETFATCRSNGPLAEDAALRRATAPPIFASSSRLRI